MKKALFVLSLMLVALFFTACEMESVETISPSTSLEESYTSSSEYSVKDFYIYNKKGFILETPLESGKCDLVSSQSDHKEVPRDESSIVMTSKGITVGSDALPSLKKYNLCLGFSLYSTDGKTQNLLTEETDLQSLLSENKKVTITVCLNQDFEPVLLSDEKPQGEWLYKIIFDIRYKTIYNISFAIE